jgi:Mrp family chromosome partitioning ATPase
VHDLGLRDYLQILRRRKWIVFQALIIVPLAAVAFSLRQSALYESSADVLLRYQSLPSTLSGISDPNSYSYYIDPVRSTDTSLQIAALPLVANHVTDALKRRGVPTADVGNTGVEEVGDTDVIRFTSSTGDPKTAAAIATEYARQFTLYFEQLDNRSINQAIKGLESRIVELQLQGTTQARRTAGELQAKINQLQTLQTLQTSSAVVVRTAAGAAKIRPTPRKYAVLGLGLGLVLGIGLAFLREAFDTRLRSGAQIAGILKLPILARVPPPPKKLERARTLVMIAEPSSSGADAFRRLRMNLEFASIGKPSQVIMFTSALPQEGKSTTLANLGVALALAGKNVAVIDLDLHRPVQARFFDVPPDRPGLSSIVLGEIDLDEALVDVPLDSLSRNAAANGSGARRAATGSLVLLPTGVLPPDPGEFVGLEAVGRVIAALRERVEVVLIDAPPLLAIGDGLTIAGFADAIVAVVRSDVARRPLTAELAGTLSRLPAAKLGFVLCGESGLDGRPYYAYGRYGYGYGSGSDESLHEEALS